MVKATVTEISTQTRALNRFHMPMTGVKQHRMLQEKPLVLPGDLEYSGKHSPHKEIAAMPRM
jgi:hypothetical protein